MKTLQNIMDELVVAILGDHFDFVKQNDDIKELMKPIIAKFGTLGLEYAFLNAVTKYCKNRLTELDTEYRRTQQVQKRNQIEEFVMKTMFGR